MRAGEKNPSKSRKLQGQVRSYNSKVMEEINHHSTKAAPEHLPCQSVHTTSDMGKEGGQDNTVGKACNYFAPESKIHFALAIWECLSMLVTALRALRQMGSLLIHMTSQEVG